MVSTLKAQTELQAMWSGNAGMALQMAADRAEAHRSLVQRAAAQLSPGIASADALVVLRLNGWDLATIDQIFADVMTELEVES